MTTTIASHRPSTVARRVGYIIAALVNVALLFAANAWPGWRVVPFLTEETTAVLGLFNLSLLIGAFVNILYALVDARWLRAFGEMVTTVIGLAVLSRIWSVFPFDFGTSSSWTFLTRLVLLVAMVGAGIGLVVNIVALGRLIVTT
ncbi:MAG: hypothetical protein ACM30G_10730 [Micromonosporaceae bacterium]